MWWPCCALSWTRLVGKPSLSRHQASKHAAKALNPNPRLMFSYVISTYVLFVVKSPQFNVIWWSTWTLIIEKPNRNNVFLHLKPKWKIWKLTHICESPQLGRFTYVHYQDFNVFTYVPIGSHMWIAFSHMWIDVDVIRYTRLSQNWLNF